jgi:hypothetical protein
MFIVFSTNSFATNPNTGKTILTTKATNVAVNRSDIGYLLEGIDSEGKVYTKIKLSTKVYPLSAIDDEDYIETLFVFGSASHIASYINQQS